MIIDFWALELLIYMKQPSRRTVMLLGPGKLPLNARRLRLSKMKVGAGWFILMVKSSYGYTRGIERVPI